VQIGSDGVILVNSGNGAASTEVLAAIKRLTDLQIRYYHQHRRGPGFRGGNAKLAKAGLNVLNGQTGAAILAHESVLTRMSARNAKPSYPVTLGPRKRSCKALRFSHERRCHRGFLPTRSAQRCDSLVLFRQSDSWWRGHHGHHPVPVIDVANGGSIQGEIDALNRLIELTVVPIPFIYNGVGTYVIPGHGRLCSSGTWWTTATW